MLEGVCQNGTGRSLTNDFFKIAGKTGTARIATNSSGYSSGMYLASFCGYLPADNPRYSLIVTFKNPRGGYYGASVAGPVFKEIVEKVYAMQTTTDQYEKENSDDDNLPDVKKGRSEDILKVVHELDLENIKGRPKSELATVEIKDKEIVLQNNELTEGKVPDVRGMGAKDAIYLLENAGLKVKIQGIGKVKQQSLNPGSNCVPGQTVYLTLS
jgi:cell division protein FtsI (penicillin-binding protein 3)